MKSLLFNEVLTEKNTPYVPSNSACVVLQYLLMEWNNCVFVCHDIW